MGSFSPDTFTITGSGFTPNSSVTIYILDSYGNYGTTTTTTADSNGDINVSISTFDIGNMCNQSYTTSTSDGYINYLYAGIVKATDNSINISSNTVNITLTATVPAPSSVGTTLSVSPPIIGYDYTGMIKFTGSGFAPNSTIHFTVSYGGQQQTLPATATTDSNGNFSKGFGYPGAGLIDSIMASYTGTMTMTATDSSGNSASASWLNYGYA